MSGRLFAEATKEELSAILNMLPYFDRGYLNLVHAWVEGNWEWMPNATTSSVIEQWADTLEEQGYLQIGMVEATPGWDNWP
jgi:hypothetical protein